MSDDFGFFVVCSFFFGLSTKQGRSEFAAVHLLTAFFLF